MIATGVKRKPPKIFQVLEFIGHQETSSGCGLMGLGEKMLSHLQTRRENLVLAMTSLCVWPSIVVKRGSTVFLG